jgi:hypothetical protein
VRAAHQWHTLRRVVRRWWEDGRVPPVTLALALDSRRRAIDETLGAVVAAMLPVRGGRPRRGTAGECIQLHGWRRWRVTSAVDSAHDMQHRLAERVIDAFESAGLAPFLTDADGRRITIGIRACDRAAAQRALRDMPDAESWFVEWWRGPRHGVSRARTRRRVVRVAERWTVFQLQRDRDDTTLGRDIAPLVTFWADGTHDRLELVGRRGLDRFPQNEPSTVEVIDGYRYPGTSSFPVSTSLHRVTMPIDIVYTWVDGDDPAWRAERGRWSGQAGEGTARDATMESRFRSRDELLYSLRALHRYAGWVRRIYVVTADQRPDWLIDDDRLRVVSHSEIFPPEWLPTFNSHAIESRLHHIDGLAEHFVYFNDDVFLGRPVPPALFFAPNGAAHVFEGEAKVPSVDDTSALGVDAAAVNGQRLILELFGRTVDRKLLHTPHPLRRSVLAEAEQRCPEVFGVTGASRFRSVTDVSIASAFAHHYGLCTGAALPGAIRAKYVNLENVQLARHFAQLRRVPFDAFCLNETEVARQNPDIEQRLSTFLEAMFPHPSPWEKRHA